MYVFPPNPRVEWILPELHGLDRGKGDESKWHQADKYTYTLQNDKYTIKKNIEKIEQHNLQNSRISDFTIKKSSFLPPY